VLTLNVSGSWGPCPNKWVLDRRSVKLLRGLSVPTTRTLNKACLTPNLLRHAQFSYNARNPLYLSINYEVGPDFLFGSPVHSDRSGTPSLTKTKTTKFEALNPLSVSDPMLAG
jgi:hypothetical protein